MNFGKIISHLPEARLIFAYGSGMFQQMNQAKTSQNMLDLVVVTNDSCNWHKQNLVKNPGHYSSLKHFGAKIISNIQDNYGAKIYYNTMVEIEGRQVKYGVISEESFIKDLTNWDTLYVSGRLHKPVHFVSKDKQCHAMEEAINTNVLSALHTALMLLPPKFSEFQLFKALANLSYTGDFRMKIGEDKKKVENIVSPNMDRFREMYEEPINKLTSYLQWNKNQATMEQGYDQLALLYHLNLLPGSLKNGISKNGSKLEDLARNPMTCQDIIMSEISRIVKQSSWSQSLKGILTAGLNKSFHYSRRKVEKYVDSQLR